MMTNLFSMFDPCNFNFKMSWMLPFMSIISPMLLSNNKFSTLMKKMSNYLKLEFFNISKSNFNNNFIISLFLVVMMLNIMSLIPSSMATTSHMSTILPLSMSLWLMNILYFLMKKTNLMMSHLVPMGSPFLLMPILVMIEITSNIIRPITLSVRLMANITAGHILIHLLSHFICLFSKSSMMLLMSLSLTLNMLELGVAIIQSYIMCTLITLYSNEIH